MNRGAHLAGELLWYRYGPNGVGLMAVPEFGLYALDGETVAAWSASRFTRDNAVAWYSGPPPDGLRFGLPEGRRYSSVPRVELEGLPRRAWIPAQIAGIGLGLVVERSTPAVMGLRTLTNRLERRLRFDQGQSYEVSLAYIPLDGTEAHASVFASSLDSEAAAVRDHFLAVVNAFAAEGPSPDEMAFDIDAVARWHEDPDSLYEELDAAVQSELFGVDPDPFPKLLAELRETTREQAREALARGLARAFLIDGVGHAPFSGGWFGYPIRSASILHGRRLDTIQRRFPWQRRSEQLIVGSDGVSWLGDDGLGLTVRYADCVGLVVEGPLRTLYGGDGFVVRVHADYWRGGQAVVREIDAAVPASRVVRINHASGS
jgi:hypothetical protein